MTRIRHCTDSELEALRFDSGSEACEREESLGGSAPDRVREAICAFANDLADSRRPGVIFIGVRDDGTPSDHPISDELLLALGDMKTDGNIVPPPTMLVERRVLRGAPIAVVTVAPADAPPVRYRGRIWIRVGPRRAIATAQDERILAEKRRHRDRSFDVQLVASATISDLSRRRFEEEYLPSAFAPEILAANERSFEQRLAATKMIASPNEPTPTVLGVLILAARPREFLPGAYAQFLRIAGTGFHDPVRDERAIDGPIQDMVRRLEEKLEAHNFTAVDFTSSPTEIRTPTYPIAALQQLVRNAVMHRTYEGTNAPVRVTWFDDRIEIQSPGGPFGAVTAENFGKPGHVDYRNPSLAEAMRVLGLVQRYGAGIATARAALRRFGHPELEFDVGPSSVRCTLRART
jgi:ATP-dependent DNA helicase RecG